MSKWAEFDKTVNCEELNKELNTVKDNNSYDNNEHVPYGIYEVKVERMELKESKKGYPMLSVMFRIVGERETNRCIFMNQVAYMGDTNDKYRLRSVFEFLNSLDSGVEVGAFNGIQALSDTIDEVFNTIDQDGLEYLLKYYQEKNFDKFAIKEVYEPEASQAYATDDVPF